MEKTEDQKIAVSVSYSQAGMDDVRVDGVSLNEFRGTGRHSVGEYYVVDQEAGAVSFVDEGGGLISVKEIVDRRRRRQMH